MLHFIRAHFIYYDFFLISDPVWASVNFCVCVCAKCIGKFISQPKGLLQAAQVLQESAAGLHLIVVLKNCVKIKKWNNSFHLAGE